MSTRNEPQPVTVYRGTQHGHDYVVLAQHPLLEAKAVLVIDGIFHDPSAETESREDPATPGDAVLGATDGKASGETDGLAFTVRTGMSKTTYTVRRPDGEGELKDAEQIIVRTALRGKGEVDVADSLGMRERPLVPEEGSASAAREARRAAHPLRFAIFAAAARAAGYLIPILGIGALFSGLLEPVVRWIGERVEPVTSWIAEVTAPIRDGIARVMSFLFGWIPDIPWPRFSVDLPQLPGWLSDVLLPVIIVLLAGMSVWTRLRRRSQHLEQSSGERAATAPGDEEDPARAIAQRRAEMHALLEALLERREAQQRRDGFAEDDLHRALGDDDL